MLSNGPSSGVILLAAQFVVDRFLVANSGCSVKIAFE